VFNTPTVFFKLCPRTRHGIFPLTGFLSWCPFVSPSRVAALGLASGIILVLLLFCLYRVFCPKNYGQNGLSHSRRKRGDLPCDDYGYSPPETEIVPLVLRGHLMVGRTGTVLMGGLNCASFVFFGLFEEKHSGGQGSCAASA